jgi:pantoate--beta-alanine ligase
VASFGRAREALRLTAATSSQPPLQTSVTFSNESANIGSVNLPPVIRTSAALRQALAKARAFGHTVGFVPTMGALHRGHLHLVEHAHRNAGFVLVSIFVNPVQFAPHEDLARYPRDLDGDVAQCAEAKVDLVFAPQPEEMYPPGDATRVRVGALAEPMCGPFRPGHFEGVATVVAKLFALASPCIAVFGRKDYQQLKVIERMACDLRFDVAIVGVTTVRDDDGLASSSRNAYLSPEERARARAVPRALAKAAVAYASGERRAAVLEDLARREVSAAADSIDYVTLADPMTLAPREAAAPLAGPTLLALAVRIGKTRLIDNMVLGEEAPPVVRP